MKILVISLAGIGDTLIATPLIHEVRQQWPEAVVDAFVLWPGARDLLENNPFLDHVHQFDLIKEGILKSLPILRQLRGQRYDLSLNVHPQSRVGYRMIARVIGASMRVSHHYDHSTALDRLLINRLIPQDYSVHSVENSLRLLEAVGKKSLLPQHQYEIYLTAEEIGWAEHFIVEKQISRQIRLGIHVGSGGTKNLPLKRWPLDHYIQLLQRLSAQHPELTLLLFGGPEEQKAHERIRKEIDSPRILIPQTRSLRHAAALLGRCDGFLSVDTALMHVAAAMRVPRQIVIEAPTLNVTNFPYGNKFHLVTNPAVHGRNLEYYRYDGGPIKGTDTELIACMQAVTVEAVYQAVVELLL